MKVKNVFLAILIFCYVLTGCGHTHTHHTDEELISQSKQLDSNFKNEQIKIIATTFAEYDWTREIIGDIIGNVTLTQLIDGGVDLHSFSPTVEDIAEITTADLFIYTGGESYYWVADVLTQTVNPNLVVINLMDVIGDNAKIEEIVEGMEAHDHDHDHADEEDDHDHDHADEEDDHDHDHDHADEEDDHDHDHDHADEEDDHDHDHTDEEDDHDHDHADEEDDHDHDHDHDHGEVYDEHIWLSLKNAVLSCEAIANALSNLDPNASEIYNINLNNYVAELNELDLQYKEMTDNAKNDVILVADRFPFRYLVDDYDLDYHAAFSGCSAETETSFETVVFLANKLDELDLKYVLTTETSNKIATTVIDNSTSKNQEVFSLNSFQSTSSNSGDTYLGIMESNLEILEIVLN